MKINLWRLSFVAVVLVSLVLMLWLMITLPIDNPKLFARLILANLIMLAYALFHGYKAVIESKYKRM